MFYHDIDTLGDESNYKSPSADGDLGVDGKTSAPSRLYRVGMLRKMILGG